MANDWRKVTGIALGLALLAGLGALWPTAESPRLPRADILADCEGALDTVVIQYVPEAVPIVRTPYREFLGALSADCEVIVMCPDQAAFDAFRNMVGPVACPLLPVLTGHPQTCWSRDRWLAGRVSSSSSRLFAPNAEEAAAQWPQRTGDHQLAADLARHRPEVQATYLDIGFDGGDFVADRTTVFVTPRVVQRNVGVTLQTRAELEETLSTLTDKRLVFLPDAPPYHAGMFMMPIGNNTVLVGDPGLVENLPPAATIDADTSPTTQARFDAVAAACRELSYRVVRMPIVPGRDQRTYLTWLNVIIDVRAGQRLVYMPVYTGVPTLNERATVIWQEEGYTVRPIDCTSTYRHFGSLRCLVNVLQR